MRRKTKNAASERVAKGVFLASAIFSVFAVFAILFYILYASLPAFREIGVFNFLFGTLWAPTKDFIAVTERFGILPMIVNSLAVTAGAVALGGTAGIFTAIFLAFYCPKKLKGIFYQLLNLLAGIPSIVYGFFGLVALVPALNAASPDGNGKGVLASSIILGVMILPTVANLAKDALTATPATYFEGALALGATKHQAVFKTVVPAAKSGVVTGLVLGVGRAVGETMAVMMVAGNSAIFPTGLFGNVRTLTTNIVIEMAYSTGLHREALIATGFVLLVFILLLNLVLSRLKKNKKSGENLRRVFFKKLRGAGASAHDRTVTSPAADADRSCIPAKAQIESLSAFDADALGADAYNADAEHCFAAVAAGHLTANRAFRLPFFEKIVRAPSANRSAANRCAGSAGVDRILFYKKGKTALLLRNCAFLVAGLVAAALLTVAGFVLYKGLPHVGWDLLFGASGNGHYTLLPAFVSTAMIIALTLLIALPLGVSAAIYLVEFSKKGSKTVKVIRLFTDTLAGIPSIVFGLFGMIFFSNALGLGYSLLSGSLTMVLIVLPTMIRSTEESLMSVPDALREASLALGASKVRTIFKVVLPSAFPGIVTAIILSVGRIVGESAALIYTSGAVGYVPGGYLDPGATFAVMMWMFSSEGLYMDNAYATAAVLLILVALINAAVYFAEKMMKRGKR